MPTSSPVIQDPVHQQRMVMLARTMNPKPQPPAPQPHPPKGFLQWLEDPRHRNSKGI
jgi:hypothetical protein